MDKPKRAGGARALPKAPRNKYRPVASPHSWGSLFPLLSPPLPFYPLPPLPSLPLEVGPLFLRLGIESGGAWALSQRVRTEPGRQTILVNCMLKIALVVAMVLRSFTRVYQSRDQSQKNAIRFLVRQSQHTIYCAVGSKSFNAVIVRKTTAQSVRHTKSNASVVLQGDFSRL